METLKFIKEKANNLVYEFERKKFLYGSITNIGEVIETDDTITIIVRQELLDKELKPNFYHLGLNGINPIFQERIDYFKLDKRVRYIFNNVTFDVPIILSCYFCDVTFKNCVFSHSYFQIHCADKLTFMNNVYYDGISSISNGVFFRTASCSKIEELNFINENFVNNYCSKYGVNNFGMDINANKVNIINSTITTNEKNGLLNIKAKKIEIKKSIITSKEIFFDASLVDMDRKSKLKCINKLVVSNKDEICDVEICISDVYSPYVSFNEVEWVNLETGNIGYYQSDLEDVQKKRREVLQVLTNLKLKCEEFQEEKTCAKTQVIKEIIKK